MWEFTLMNKNLKSAPWFLVMLDAIGVVFLVVAVLAWSGVDFGYPVLREVAPGFLVIGILLMLPFLIWVIRK